VGDSEVYPVSVIDEGYPEVQKLAAAQVRLEL